MRLAKLRRKSAKTAAEAAPKRANGKAKPANEPFWRTKSLKEMSKTEWESLCDGCGRCCTVKFEDLDTGRVEFTDVACRQLDTKSCRCKNYAKRKTLVPDCIALTVRMIGKLHWLPSTCAYRLIDEGKDLHWWHPLVSGDPNSVHKAGISVRNKVVSEDDVEDAEERIVTWIK
ncbi:MAG TPA: YcgN family cysteine cluster protein [Hypericibacter adhaerens]|jgi:uncharacterized cysteine cluster protein YcgN (CxxCxxCC family)|uniref:UPF0260 protein FRZ61_00280 n=2 Tax=Hypericibacter adhaerens TaxID=2602016 RepID=A0A5J6MRR4_9PROT|nr:YcgN family cysteine cluster protein [Hypericibacter adhaerens]QEX20114.1 UPF0260 protein [Hypericibacter adhaerens]HWA45927.1 YcgN family cysteine cluster protein [Hypericibacter adhaerens]